MSSGVKASKRPVAVFDIDGTIFRSSLLIELVDGLIMQGVFPSSARKVYAVEYKRWLNREDSYDKYVAKVVAAYSRYIKGVRDERIWRVARRVMSFHQRRLYRYTRDLLVRLQRTHFLIAISWSPVEIVAPFCRELGFNKVYGRVYAVDKKMRFTGKEMYEDLVNNKSKILRRALKKEDLTLKGSVGVGDSESDISFLKMVERPIAFNPNTKLYRVAKKRGWLVVVERKDMIYVL